MEKEFTIRKQICLLFSRRVNIFVDREREKMNLDYIILMEECGELVQAASKMIRTGGEAKYLQNFQDEIGDVLCMIERMKEQGLVTDEMIRARIVYKEEKLRRWE